MEPDQTAQAQRTGLIQLLSKEIKMMQSKPLTAILGVISAALLSAALADTALTDTGSEDHQEQAMLAAAGALDLDALTSKILETPGIGVFDKLDIQRRFNALLNDISLYHQGLGDQSASELQRRFNHIILQIAARLRKGDPALHNELVTSRDVIWRAINAKRNVH